MNNTNVALSCLAWAYNNWPGRPANKLAFDTRGMNTVMRAEFAKWRSRYDATLVDELPLEDLTAALAHAASQTDLSAYTASDLVEADAWLKLEREHRALRAASQAE